MSYAEGTTVAPEKTKFEIESVVTKYGATHYGTANAPGQAGITFVCHGRMVKFTLPLPNREEMKAKLKKDVHRWRTHWGPVPDDVADNACHQENRRRWRCLLLAIKSKLEVVETGIETFDQAFLANIVTDGLTIYERLTLTTSPIKLLAASTDSESP